MVIPLYIKIAIYKQFMLFLAQLSSTIFWKHYQQDRKALFTFGFIFQLSIRLNIGTSFIGEGKRQAPLRKSEKALCSAIAPAKTLHDQSSLNNDIFHSTTIRSTAFFSLICSQGLLVPETLRFNLVL